ncbi:EMB2654 [Symbiodinium microadriaticum]|nr:EMB2654 [Symbiodinium microadriaticum]
MSNLADAIRASKHEGMERTMALLQESLASAVEADQASFSAALKACRRLAAWQSAVVILSALSASQSTPDVITCGGALSCLARAGQWQHAMALLAQMKAWQVQSNCITSNAALSACEKGSSWIHALSHLSCMAEDLLPPDAISFSAAINEKSKPWPWVLCLLGKMERTVSPDVITFNAAISACRHAEGWKVALQLLEKMQAHHLLPDSFTHGALTTSLERESKWELALALAADMKGLTVEISAFARAALISACGQASQWVLTLRILKQLGKERIRLNEVLIGAAIRACGEGGQWHHAMHLLDRMVGESVVPNQIIYNAAVGALEGTGHWTTALWLWDDVCMRFVQPNRVTYNALMLVCGDASQWSYSVELLQLPEVSVEADLSSWSAAMLACDAGSQWQVAVGLLATSPLGQESDAAAWRRAFGICMSACDRCQEWDMVLSLFGSLNRAAIAPDSAHLQLAIAACSRLARWQMALLLLATAVNLRIPCSIASCTMAATACRDAAAWQAALTCLASLPAHALTADSTMYAATISVLGDASMWQRSIGLLQETLAQEELQLAGPAVCAVISACDRASQWEKALYLFQQAAAEDTTLEVSLATAGINACRTGRKWQHALVLYHDVQEPTIVCCNAALSACAEEGVWQKAFCLLQQLQSSAALPDEVSCGAVLSSCERASQWQLALDAFWMLGPSVETFKHPKQCYDILNRVFATSTQWEHCLALAETMLLRRLSANGMHVASTSRAVQSALGIAASQKLLLEALERWKSRATAEQLAVLNYDLRCLCDRPGSPNILAARPGIVAVAKPPDTSTEDILKKLADTVLEVSGSRKLAQFTSCSRLDLPTSGVLVVAHGGDGSPAANWLQAQFASRVCVRKNYLCVCVGRTLGDVGTKGEITTPLLLKQGEGMSGVAVPSDEGLEAHTLYEVLARHPFSAQKEGEDPELIYLRVQPLTGRMHQIRAHFASIFRPLLGDRKYCDALGPLGSISPQEAKQIFGLSRLFLHCQKMEMQDLDGQLFEIEMPLPPDLELVVRQLSDPGRWQNKARDFKGKLTGMGAWLGSF